jgi:hypothetical protein
MSSREDTRLADFSAIPDPAAGKVPREAPAVAPPTEPSLTRAARRTRGWIAFGAAVGWILILLMKFGARADLMTASVVAQITIWLVIACAGLALALRPDARGLPRGVRIVQGTILAASVGFTVLVIVLTPANTKHVSGAYVCLIVATAMMLGPLFFAAIVLGRSFLSAPGWRGAALGAIAGLAAATGIQAHCPIEAMDHVLLTHGLPILLGAVIGGLWGRTLGRV